QVKSQQPEDGFWKTNTDAFAKSIKRFVELDGKYPGAIRRFAFVSNTQFLDSDAKSQAGRSPLFLLRAVVAAKVWEDLCGAARDCLVRLKEDTGATDDGLFSVLTRLDLKNGPSRDAFVAELAHNHLSQLDHCRDFNAERLEDV